MPKADLILVPIDFSAGSEQAARFASEIAGPLGGRLRLLHVVPPTTPPPSLRPDVYQQLLDARRRLRDEAERALGELAGRLGGAGGPAAVERVVVETEGSVGEAIIDAARDSGADLIVIGTHGRRGVERMLLGSVAERVIRGASCPVVTVRAAG